MIDEANMVESETVPVPGPHSPAKGGRGEEAALLFACLALVTSMVGAWVASSAKDSADAAHSEVTRVAADAAEREFRAATVRLDEATDVARERGDDPLACVFDRTSGSSGRVLQYDDEGGWSDLAVPSQGLGRESAYKQAAARVNECADSLMTGPIDVVLGRTPGEVAGRRG